MDAPGAPPPGGRGGATGTGPRAQPAARDAGAVMGLAGGARERLRMAAPSLLTLGALVSGLSAVRFASEEKFSTSVTMVMLAAVLDGLDGHVARYLNACTSLGFELDSLCDCANFGVVPSLVAYFWAKSLPGKECWSEDCGLDHALLWISCCCYSGCCALRLARFNVAGHASQMDQSYPVADAAGTPVQRVVRHNFLQRKLYFEGVPAPVGAAYALTPMILHYSATARLAGAVGELGAWAIGRRGTALTLLLTAVLMVCSLPTFSSKMLKTGPKDSHLRSRHRLSLASKACAGIATLVIFWHFPFDVILLLNLVHFVSIPVAAVVFYRFATDKHD